MKMTPLDPPRRFVVGRHADTALTDAGRLSLEPDEQVTLTTAAGGEWDVTRKSWGFYATPSLNGRLSDHGLRAVLVRSRVSGRGFVLLVERGHERAFAEYLEREGMDVMVWLDSTATLDHLARVLAEVTP